jgi:N-methylhydantoinase A
MNQDRTRAVKDRARAMWVAGIDVGGTFTDLIAVESASKEVRLAKVPTTPENQAFGVLAALEEAKLKLPEIALLIHGTTTTTNALLERKLARTGLVTTRGFRDVLELGRRTRPHAYGLTGRFEPLIPRELRCEAVERMDAGGEVVTPLDEESVRTAVQQLAAAGCESLVIHFLHSYLNPSHEAKALEIARKIWPNGYITAGHTLLSEYREYERGVTAAVNAAVQPVLDRYLRTLLRELGARGFTADLLVMQGNGGTVSAVLAAETAVNTVMSGPASGIIAAAHVTAAADHPNAITYDMGGTSTDVGLIRDGVPQVSSELEIEYAMPVHVPMVDVHTIGAGGGSIATIGEDGMLRVGPRSAGARPGPICYGRGGTEPTITDANLILGRLNPDRLLGVSGAVNVRDIENILVEKIGKPLELDAAGAAAAILRIANDKMAGAIRMVSLSRGHDPRDFVLFPFGGAGPLHAAALARELGIPRLLVPARPGITNAIGCVVADLRQDYVNTVNKPVSELAADTVPAIFARQIAAGRKLLERQGVAIEGIRLLHSADMQFQGQSHILSVPLAEPRATREELQQLFERAYYERFGVELPQIRAVLVNLHTAVIGLRPHSAMGLMPSKPDAAAPGRRKVWFENGWLDTPVYQRESLPPGINGPAIIEQLDCTTVLEPGNRADIDASGNLLVTV